MYKEALWMAWASLVANKLRTALTMLGIIIGVSAVVALVSVGFGVRAQIQNNLAGLGTNLLIVHPGSPHVPGVRPVANTLKTLKNGDYKILQHMPGVTAISPMSSRAYITVHGHNNWTTAVGGVAPSFLEIRDLKTKEGTFISDNQVLRRERVAVIGTSVQEHLFPKEDPIGKEIRIDNQPFSVIGVLDKKGSSGGGNTNDDIIYIPYTTYNERLAGQDYYSAFFILGDSAVDLKRLEQDVTNVLRINHHVAPGAEEDFTIQNMQSVMEKVEETTGMLTSFLGTVAAISLLVGGIGIMNIMLVSVTERTREIGIRKALGATYRIIITQFLIEAVVISLLGGITGIILGMGFSVLISWALSLPLVISLMTICISFAFSVAIGLLFGYYPARKAAKLHPIDALHYE